MLDFCENAQLKNEVAHQSELELRDPAAINFTNGTRAFLWHKVRDEVR